jgi:hypothetical protein
MKKKVMQNLEPIIKLFKLQRKMEKTTICHLKNFFKQEEKSLEIPPIQLHKNK